MANGGGFGMVVKVAVGTAGTLTAIAQLADADWPKIENVLADITAHDSSGGYQEFIASGRKNVGTFDMDLIWDVAEATHAELVTLETSGASVGWSIEDPDGAEVVAFNAIVVGIGRMTEQEDARRATVTVQPTGAWAIS